MANHVSTVEDVRKLFHTKYIVLPNGCFEWQGAITSTAYGSLSWQRKTWMAHRMAWFLEYGMLPGELPPYDENMLDHLCMNKRCVNIEHLEPVTRAENTARVVGHLFYRADKTKCKSGLHEWIPENMVKGRSECRLCANIKQAERAILRKVR